MLKIANNCLYCGSNIYVDKILLEAEISLNRQVLIMKETSRKNNKSSKSKSPSKNSKRPNKTNESSQPRQETNHEHHIISNAQSQPTVYSSESLPFVPVDNPFQEGVVAEEELASSAPNDIETSEDFSCPECMQLKSEDFIGVGEYSIENEDIKDPDPASLNSCTNSKHDIQPETENNLGESLLDIGNPSTLNLSHGQSCNNSKASLAQQTVDDAAQMSYLDNRLVHYDFQRGASLHGFCCAPCLTSCTRWWKTRSKECSKCRALPLVRPKSISSSSGYGMTRPNSTTANGSGDHVDSKNICDDRLLVVHKSVPGLCSCCSPAQEQSDEKINKAATKKENHLLKPTSNKKVCNCEGKSEYQCSYAHPAFQSLIRRGNRRGRNQIGVQKDTSQRKLMSRPPWNYDTSIQPPKFYEESIGATEAKLRALDYMLQPKSKKHQLLPPQKKYSQGQQYQYYPTPIKFLQKTVTHYSERIDRPVDIKKKEVKKAHKDETTETDHQNHNDDEHDEENETEDERIKNLFLL